MPKQFQPACLGQQLLRRVKVPCLRICKESARLAIDHLEFIITEIASEPECPDTLSKCVDILKDTRDAYTSQVLIQEIVHAQNRDVNARALLLGKPCAWRDRLIY